MTFATELDFTPRQRLLSLAAVTATAFGVGLSFGIGFPLTALTFEEWHQPSWMIGLVGAAPAVAVLIALPALPPILARLGAVTAIAIGCLTGAIGFIGLYAFPYPWAWIVTRLLMSLGFAFPWLAGETWINSVSEERMRGRVIAVYAMAFFLGFVIGPVILQDMVLDSFMPFLAGAIGTAVASVPILLARRLAPEFCGDASRDLMTAIKMTPAAMIAAFIGGFAEIGILSLIPNVALSAGLSESDALRLLSITTIGGIVLQFPIGWLSDKTSRFAVTIALSITFIVLVLALPMVLGTSEPTGVVAFLLGGVILGFYTLGLAVIGERVDASRLAAANAAFLLMYQAGSILGPLAAGIAMTMAPLAGFVVSMVALMSVCAIAVIVLERSERRRAHAEI